MSVAIANSSHGDLRSIPKTITVVPWYNVNQFKKVYEYLCSSELVKKRWAVDQISVWETRCHPSLPSCIEASVVISRAIIQDILLTNGATLCQERDIQMMYSMALVRFVNLTVERHQNPLNQGTAAQIAKGLGIPSWIVDLRNEATHSVCPSVPALRMAAEAAMKYLNESFWEKEISTVKNCEKEPFDEREIRRLIHSYITLKYYLSADSRRTSYEQFSQDADEFRTVLRKLPPCIQKNKRQFINILISDGYFIPFDEDLKALMTSQEQLLYEEECDDNSSKLLSVPPIPPALEDLWKVLLDMLNILQVIPILLEALLKSQADRTEIGKKLVISWVMKILRIHSIGYCYEDASLKKIFHKKGILLNWNTLFYAAVSRPCVYTPYVFPLIFGHLDLKENITRYILNLMAIALGQAADHSEHYNYYSPFTVEDLKQMKQLQDAKRETDTKSLEESIWSFPQDTSYQSWPIGIVINPLEESEKADEQLEDPNQVDFVETMDVTEELSGNENDNEEYFVIDEPNSSEDEDLGERTFLYKRK